MQENTVKLPDGSVIHLYEDGSLQIIEYNKLGNEIGDVCIDPSAALALAYAIRAHFKEVE